MFYIDHSEALDKRVIIVDIKGALTSETSKNFEEYINILIEKKKEFIILNSKDLEYISSGGIGLVLYIQKRLSSLYGYFIILNIPKEIRILFNLLGFDKIFTIAQNMDDALQMMEKQLELRETGNMAESEEMEDEIGVILRDEDLKKVNELHGMKKGPSKEKPHSDIPSVSFENPIIVECAQCNGLIRLKKSGQYLCPDCHSEFVVHTDQSIAFINA